MPSRSWTGSTLVTSLPSTVSVPEVGSIIRLIIRIDVVLPQPDGPTNTVSVPSGPSSVRSSTATVPSGDFLVTFSKLIIQRPLKGDQAVPPYHHPRVPLDRQEASVGDCLSPAFQSPLMDRQDAGN